ncbi:MAG: hypothetical protein HY706_21420 [Candidatus Hydrogenedentes bacterium]|nr:hypothetical protein [Candidatus Hydrogenedentota bacterium]
MPTERLLITVKTYPTLSRKYGELVCTAAVREDGSWVRLYPIPFRFLDYKERYAKYDWIETVLVKNSSDHRPESFHPVDPKEMKKVGHLGTDDNWRERRKMLLGRCATHTSLNSLIDGAHKNEFSLAMFKPTQVLAFKWEVDERQWDPVRVDEMRKRADQGELFGDEDWRRSFKLIPKLPYKFSYRFADSDGRESELLVLDWEVGMLFWHCLEQTNGDEKLALAKVHEKYFNQFLQTDLHFFLGTTQQYHDWSANPWLIVGVFPIPYESQMELGQS